MTHPIHTFALATILASPFFAPPNQDSLSLEPKGREQILEIAERFWRARPETQFYEWDASERSQILRDAVALGALPEGELERVLKLCWAPVSEFGPGIPKAVYREAKPGEKKRRKLKRPSWLPRIGKRAKKVKKITLDTPYGEAWFYVENVGSDRGLILGLHGGGPGAGAAEEPRGTWKTKDCIGMYPQAIRLVSDSWNTVHGERFLLTIIEIAKAHFGVDPDRIYSMGFSMGGTGSWFMAGRHADLLAGASPCAGVLMASPRSQLENKDEVTAIQHGLVPNVRNLAMYYYIGLKDVNCMPGTYLYVADMLEQLRSEEEGGYQKIRFSSYEGLAHDQPRGEPKANLKWLPKQTRETYPKTVIWETALDPFPIPVSSDQVGRRLKSSFYWLGAKSFTDNQWVRATISENRIELSVRNRADGTSGLVIYLNDKMIDPSEDVVVLQNGAEIYRGKPIPNLGVVLESLDERVDRSMVFDRKIEL